MDITVFRDQVNNVVFGAHLFKKNVHHYVPLTNSENATKIQTCIATGKSLAASGGKYTSTAFFGKG